jgi:hypothetical protein
MTGRRWLRRAGWLAAVCGLSAAVSLSAWALQRMLKSKAHNYASTPVALRQSKVTLVEVFAAPTVAGIPDAGKSRVRYANRAGLTPPNYRLKGEVLCVNESPQAVEALKLTVIALDAFHQPIAIPGQGSPYSVEQVVGTIPRSGSRQVSWDRTIGSADVYEVAVVVTAVRFADGSVWMAPDEELIETF